MIKEFKNEKFKIVVYTRINNDINGLLFLSEEHFYSSSRSTWSAFDNWYSDDVTYEFDKLYGESNWSTEYPDEDTQILYVDNIPMMVVKLVHIYGTHLLE